MRVDALKNSGDAASIGVLLGTFLQALPHVAAILTVIWCAYRVYDMRLAIRERKLRIERLEAGDE